MRQKPQAPKHPKKAKNTLQYFFLIRGIINGKNLTHHFPVVFGLGIPAYRAARHINFSSDYVRCLKVYSSSKLPPLPPDTQNPNSFQTGSVKQRVKKKNHKTVGLKVPLKVIWSLQVVLWQCSIRSTMTLPNPSQQGCCSGNHLPACTGKKGTKIHRLAKCFNF